MISQVVLLFAPMLLGAQLVLLIVLVKGDICPGQRGRIHKVLPYIGLLWLAVAVYLPVALILSLPIFYFYSRVKTSKTRDRGPLQALYIACAFSILFVLVQAFQQSTIAVGLVMLVSAVLLGASFAHLLLTMAKTRLQAFHRILPFCGVVASIVIVILTLIHAYGPLVENSEHLLNQAIVGLVLLLIGVFVWCAHIVVTKSPSKVQLSVSLALLVASTSYSWGMFIV